MEKWKTKSRFPTFPLPTVFPFSTKMLGAFQTKSDQTEEAHPPVPQAACSDGAGRNLPRGFVIILGALT